MNSSGNLYKRWGPFFWGGGGVSLGGVFSIRTIVLGSLQMKANIEPLPALMVWKFTADLLKNYNSCPTWKWNFSVLSFFPALGWKLVHSNDFYWERDKLFFRWFDDILAWDIQIWLSDSAQHQWQIAQHKKDSRINLFWSADLKLIKKSAHATMLSLLHPNQNTDKSLQFYWQKLPSSWQQKAHVTTEMLKSFSHMSGLTMKVIDSISR